MAIASIMSVVAFSAVALGFSTGIFSLPDTEKSFNEEFNLKYGQTVTIKDSPLSIHFTDVPEDSRCPTDVDCFWEGRVTVTLEIKIDGEIKGTYNLTPAANPTNQLDIGDGIKIYSIELLDVLPLPVVDQQTPLSDYVIRLVVKWSYKPD